MKLLMLLRHAKSSKEDPSLRDFDRPLNERGIGDSALIGKLIRKQKIVFDLVISSPAKRARQTSALVIKAAGLRLEPEFDERIYEASARALMQVVSEIKNSANSVILVGHNPGFEELLELLTNESRDLPTASLSSIELDLDQWRSVRAGKGVLKSVVTPKQLKKG